MEQSLFRKEVVEANSQAWLGSVRLATPISHQVWTVASLVVCIAISAWLFLGHYTRRLHVAGFLVPRQGLISVASSSVGVVGRVLVLEGSHVKAGAPLMEVSSEHASEAFGNTSEDVSRQLRGEEKTLRDDIDSTQTLQIKQADDFRDQLSKLQGQISQIDDQIALQKQQVDLANGLVEKWKPLLSSGYVSILTVEQERSTLLNAQLQYKSLEQQRYSIEQQISSMRDQLSQLPAATLTKVNDLRRQLAQVEQTLFQNEASRSILLRATESGVVTSIQVKPGQSVSVSEPVLSIVPDGSTLQAQLLVPSDAIGFIHNGMKVQLHYQAFPYEKFGLKDGTVTEISSSALMPAEASILLGGGQPPAQGPLYVVRVDLTAQQVMAYGHQEPLKPGMALDADLLMDSRRVFEWIFEPLYGIGRRMAKS